MQTSGSLIRPVASSFPLHILLSLSVIFVPAWWALTFALLIYKGTQLPYPPTALGLEITVTFFIWVIQYWGVKLSKRGNLTENSGVLIVGLVLLIFSIGGMFYFTFGQTYVMRIDRGFSVTLLVMNGLCLILGVLAMKDFGATPMTAAQQQQHMEQQQQALEEQQMQQMMMNATASAQHNQAQQQQQQQDGFISNNNNNNNNAAMMQQQQQQQQQQAAVAQQQWNNNFLDQQQQQQQQMWQQQQQQQQQNPAIAQQQGNVVPPPGVG